jgi:hypothetical protein
MRSISCLYYAEGAVARQAYDFVTRALRGTLVPGTDGPRRAFESPPATTPPQEYDRSCVLFDDFWSHLELRRAARRGTSRRAAWAGGHQLRPSPFYDYWGVVQDTPEAFRWSQPSVLGLTSERARPPAGTRCIELFYAWYQAPFGRWGLAQSLLNERGSRNYERFRRFRAWLETEWEFSREHTAMPAVGRFFGRPDLF